MKREFKLYLLFILAIIIGVISGFGLVYSAGALMKLIWPLFGQYFLYGVMIVFCSALLAGCIAATSYLNEQIRDVKSQRKSEKTPTPRHGGI